MTSNFLILTDSFAGNSSGGGDNPAASPIDTAFTCRLGLNHYSTKVGKYSDGTPFSIGTRNRADATIEINLATQPIGVEYCTSTQDWQQDENNLNSVNELDGHCITISGQSDFKDIHMTLKRGSQFARSRFSLGKISETTALSASLNFQSETELYTIDHNGNPDVLTLTAVCSQKSEQ